MACVSVCRSITSSVRVSPSGVRSSTSARNIPTAYAIEANAQALARYAALCQEQQSRPDRRGRKC